MLSENSLKEKIISDQFVLGTFVEMTGAEVVDLLGKSGFDFAIIDLEHGPYWIEKMVELVRACGATGITPICRIPIPEINLPLITKCLEVGTQGIMIPQIRTAKEAKQVVETVREYKEREQAKDEILITLIIEDKEAVANFRDIIRVKGVDALLMGPGDLSYSLGHPGEMNHPEVTDTFRRLIKEASEKGMTAGMYVESVQEAEEWLKQGAKFLVYGLDTQIFRVVLTQIRESVDRLR